MTGHYTTATLARLWSDETTLRTWREVEIAVLQAQIEVLGWDPTRADIALETPEPTVAAWRTETARTGHEVVGFLHAWDVPYVHIGLTSSDVVDTALALRLRAASRHLLNLTYGLRTALGEAAGRYRDVRRVGRTHGQPAVPTTLGLRFADLAFAADRAAKRLYDCTAGVSMGKLSGPVGNYLHISPAVERKALLALGLQPAPAASQIVMRDGMAVWAGVLGAIAGICEAVAIEVRLSAHEGLQEMFEAHSAGEQVGSSAMPHKKNPIVAERICGLARLARSSYEPLTAGIAQWHERDLAHSSVERVLLPQLTGCVGYSLEKTRWLVDTLRVMPLQMETHLLEAGPDTSTHSALTALLEAGWMHADAHRAVAEIRRSTPTTPKFWLAFERQTGVSAPNPPQPDVSEQIRAAKRLGYSPASQENI